MKRTNAQAVKLVISLAIPVLLIGCGTDVSTTRGESKKHIQSEVNQEIDAFEIGEELLLTDAELSNIKRRVQYADTRIKSILAAQIKAVTDECNFTVNYVAKIKADLAAANVETMLLISSRDGLSSAKNARVTQQTSLVGSLSDLQGKVAALRVAVANAGPSLRTALTKLNREFSDKISNRSSRLIEVRKLIDQVIVTIPFDLKKYEALDTEQDTLALELGELRKQLEEQTKILMSVSTAEISKLKADLIIAEKALDDQLPVIRTKLAELKLEIAKLSQQLAKVLEELANNKLAAGFVVPMIPEACARLRISSEIIAPSASNQK
jgi:hypothetical protein